MFSVQNAISPLRLKIETEPQRVLPERRTLVTAAFPERRSLNADRWPCYGFGTGTAARPAARCGLGSGSMAHT